MRKLIVVLSLLLVSQQPIHAMVSSRTTVASDQSWHGPGNYDGVWYDNEQDYYDWQNQNPNPYDTDTQTIIWIGPGWYGGFWFDNEADFYGWRRGYYHNHGGHWHGGHGGGNYHNHGGGGHGGGHGGGGHH